MTTLLALWLTVSAGWLVGLQPPVPQPTASSAMLLTTERSAEILDRGRTEVLGGRFAAGETTFRLLFRRPDGGPAALHHLATTSLLRVLILDRSEDYDQFFGRSDSLRDVLADMPRSHGRSFLEGEADFQRSIAWAKKGQYVRAAMAGVSAYRALTELVEEAPDFWEAYKSIGIVHSMLGTLPRRYRRFLSVFGFETDLEVGLDQLEIAVEESSYSREESLVFLSVLDAFQLPSRVSATETLHALWTNHQESPLFGMVLLDVLLRSRRVAEAEMVVRALETGQPGVVELEYLDFFLGEIRMRQEAWKEASDAFSEYLASHEGSAFKALAALDRGLSLEMAGDLEGAADSYRLATGGRDMDVDEASARLARSRLETPMSPPQRTLLQARMSFDRSDEIRADSLLRALAANGPGDEAFQAEVAYRLGRALDETGRDAEALDRYRAAADRPGDPTAKWAPYSLYYIGRIHAEAGRVSEAMAAYRAVLDYRPSYDYRGTNEQRARFALQRLEDG